MISITEREPIIYGKGNHKKTITPTYMVKDGAEFFLFNKNAPATSTQQMEYENRINQVVDVDGRFLKFRGHYATPIDAIYALTAKHGNLRGADFQYITDVRDSEGYYDFSCGPVAFRIYDEEYADTVGNLLAAVNA